MSTNQKLILEILKEESPLKLNEIKLRFIEKMKLDLPLSNFTLEKEISKLYLEGLVGKNDGKGGWYLTKKGQRNKTQ